MSGIALTALVVTAGLVAWSQARAEGKMIVGLVTKTNVNPFFVKMREGAEAEAKKSGVELRAFAGKYDGDNQSQVEAIENLVAAGAKGILVVPSDSAALVPTVKKARDAGVLVITLDTPLDPITAADATFATDNFKAGQLIGEWAKATLGAKAATAKIAMLDLNPNQISVDVLRHNGFLTGFGIKVDEPKRKKGGDNDPRIVGSETSNGAEDAGRTAMEKLLQKDPNINLVYAINEPAAAGAYAALKAAGKEKGVLVVAVDGGCNGVKNVQAGVIGATSQQYPLLMAAKGIAAIVEFAKSGKKPASSPGLDFFDTGVNLVTDRPAKGVNSISTKEGMNKCWG
ncbi:MAG: substrate-binding domain-containing protein [Candidatus Symbiobacter sp.]|nr:substrate-binding domain-containing protein [Candidatus Symbiobacter sp.]